MNLKIVKNKYVNAILWLVIFSATVHMINLFYLSLSWGDLYILNYFNILDLDILLPYIFINNFLGNLISFIFVAFVYFLILKIIEWKEKNEPEKK